MKFKLAFTAAAAALAMAAATAPAQAREMYVRGSLGAAGSWAGDATTKSSTSTAETQTFERTTNSLGRGLSMDASVGMELAPHVYGEVGLGYLYGLPFEGKQVTVFGSTTETTTSNLRGQMLRLTPALVITAGTGSLKPYARVGVVLGIPSAVETIETSTSNNQSSEEVAFTGGPELGLTGAAGVEVPVGTGLALAFELNYLAMAFSPSNAKLTKSTKNGVDKLPTMTTREKEIEFVDKRTVVFGETPSEGSPTQAASTTVPFSNFGAAVSLVYKF